MSVMLEAVRPIELSEIPHLTAHRAGVFGCSGMSQWGSAKTRKVF